MYGDAMEQFKEALKVDPKFDSRAGKTSGICSRRTGLEDSDVRRLARKR